MTDNVQPLIRPGLWAPRKQIEDVKKNLRAKVPKISIYEIRHERMSHHEALISHLYEDGYRLSAKYIEDLIKLERNFIKSKKFPEPYLTIAIGKQCLLDIANYLKQAEIKLTEFDELEAVEKLLELADYLTTHESKLWIVEQIHLIALDSTKKYRLNGGLLEARVRYLYGRFLIEKCNLYEPAYQILKVANSMSVAKEWTITLGPGIGKNISREVNYLLFICLSNQEVDRTQSVSVELSKKALKYALASENKYIIPRAYIERGDREVDMKNYSEATNFYSKGIGFAQVSNQWNYICEGYLKKGNCLHKMNVVSRATAFAKLAKKAAEDSNDKFFLGKAYMLLGEIAVTRACMNIAKFNFLLAVDIFTELKNEKMASDARFKGAFAMAHLVLEPLVSLIRMADSKKSNTKCLAILIEWKERQTPFWDSDECNLKSISEVGEANAKISLVTDFGIYENVLLAERHNLDMNRDTNIHKHIFREFSATFREY